MKTRITLVAAVIMAFFAGFEIAYTQINAFPSYKEDFESGNGGWSASGYNSSWQWGTPSKSYLYGAANGRYCWTTNLYGSYNYGEMSYITSPQLDFSCYTADPTIQFSLWYFTAAWPDCANAGYDFFWLEVSTNGGSSWTKVGNAGSGKNWYGKFDDWWNGNGVYEAWGGDLCNYQPIGWLTASNKLSGVAGKNNVRIRFYMFAQYGGYGLDGVAFDDMLIYPDNPNLPMPTLASPANNAINVPAMPTLVWNASTCATGYDVQISSDPSFASPVVNVTNVASTSYTSSTSLALGSVYYWRVRARGNGGITSNWTNAWSFTTQFPPPPMPILASPLSGSTAQPMTIPLSWNSARGALNYQLQISTNSSFTNNIVDQSLPGTSFNFDAPNNYTYYYWRVNASNPQGTSPWSATWYFRTIVGTPILSQPASAMKGIVTPVSLNWNSVVGATSYDLQVSKSATFATLDYNGSIIGTSAVLASFSTNTQYFWRTRAAAGSIERGNWSTVWNFSTLVGTPILAQPFDGTLDLQPQTITFSWNPVEGLATYRIQVATDLLFANKVADTQNIAGTTVDIKGLQRNTLYYWRVKAISAINGESSWSNFYTYTTIVDKVSGISPANGNKGVALPVPIVWTSAGDGKTYQIQIATDDKFKNIVVADEKIGEVTGSYTYNTGLNDYTKYYWRVRPITKSNAVVPWSDVMSFTSNIGSPILTTPINGAMNQPIAVSLSWKAPIGAVKYTVRVFEDTPAQTPVFEDNNVIGTTIIPTGIKAEMKYIWTVQAADADNNTSFWSQTWKFATTTVFAATPELVKPANNTNDAATEPTLEWKTAEYALTYDVQVSSYSNFSSTIVNLTGLTDITLPVKGLSNGERYFWHVRSVNAAGPSAWSETWTFVVSPMTPAMVNLLSPPNGAEKQEQNVGLHWSSVTGSDYYQVQVSDKSDFSSTIHDRSGLAATSFNADRLQPSTIYYWRVRAFNIIGEGQWSEVWSFTTDAVSGLQEQQILHDARLSAVYPNPVSHTATIVFSLNKTLAVTLSVINNIGETVATIANGEFGEGDHSFDWNASQIPSGTYMVRLKIGNASVTQTLNIVK